MLKFKFEKFIRTNEYFIENRHLFNEVGSIDGKEMNDLEQLIVRLEYLNIPCYIQRTSSYGDMVSFEIEGKKVLCNSISMDNRFILYDYDVIMMLDSLLLEHHKRKFLLETNSYEEYGLLQFEPYRKNFKEIIQKLQGLEKNKKIYKIYDKFHTFGEISFKEAQDGDVFEIKEYYGEYICESCEDEFQEPFEVYINGKREFRGCINCLIDGLDNFDEYYMGK